MDYTCELHLSQTLGTEVCPQRTFGGLGRRSNASTLLVLPHILGMLVKSDKNGEYKTAGQKNENKEMVRIK
jgi:hypothetical protein